MILMDVRIDNFYLFSNFHMNFSYPKKIVGSYIENEHLKDYPNFRYKKVNIIMGANATGKTTLGKALMAIFNFIDDTQYQELTAAICDTSKTASFSIDVVLQENQLFRISAAFSPAQTGRYGPENVRVNVQQTKILFKDNYEACAKRLEAADGEADSNYMEELKKLRGLGWFFIYPEDQEQDYSYAYRNDLYLEVLKQTLRILDPSIQDVERLKEVENALVIRMGTQDIILQSHTADNLSRLSSGTQAGLEIAELLAGIFTGQNKFYYCDEKFSYVHSEVEKTMLTVMIHRLRDNNQLFFTTHNTDILDLPLPKHSFTFLRKQMIGGESRITCVCASELLKRNTDSLRSAYENDLFSVLPDVDAIYSLAEL